MFTGSYATNPVTGQDIPIWIADYVLMGYGTGAIMAVPCGDQRDFEFARVYGLDIPAIQQPPDEWFAERGIAPTLDTSTWPEAFVGDAPYVASANDGVDLNGMTSVEDGTATINAWLEAEGVGEATINYKLRDWLFSRQRYWGEPFPIVYDVDGHPHALPDDELPLTLPDTDQFSPRTFDPDDEFSEPESPLDRLTDWVEVTLDIGDGQQPYRRDTNVMPQWAGSCWYELRYCDPTNENEFVDPAVERYWMGPQTDLRPDHPGGVDLYVGGVEHGVLHLLYSRFWHKVLYDLGHVSSLEPYARLFNQGYILADAYLDEREVYVEASAVTAEPDGTFTYEGRPVQRRSGKMGKSLKNAVPVEEMYEAYGSDTLRLHLMATGPLDASRPWETRDVVGMYRFLQRLWRNVVSEATGEVSVADTAPARRDEPAPAPHDRRRAQRGRGAALQHRHRQADRAQQPPDEAGRERADPREAAEALVLMVSPFAPHIGEELWLRLGHDGGITYVPFPVADPALLVEDTIEYPVQVNGKVRGHVTVAADADQATVEAAALVDDRVARGDGGGDPEEGHRRARAGWSTSSSDGGGQPAQRSATSAGTSSNSRTSASPAASSRIVCPSRPAATAKSGSSSTRRTAAAIACSSRRPLQRDAGPAHRDAPGVVGLVAAVRQHDERHAGGQGAHDRAVTAVGHDGRGVAQHLRVRRGRHDRHAGAARSSAAGSMAGPVVTIVCTGSVAMASMMRCRQATWSWNVDDRATSTSGRPSVAGLTHGSPAHAGSSRTGAHVAGVRRHVAGEVEPGRRQHELAAGAVHLVEERPQRGEPVRRPQRVDVGDALVPLALRDRRDEAVTGPSAHPPGRRQAEADRRDAPRRQQVGVREEHVERDAGGLGRDHRPDGEERAHDEVGPDVVDRRRGVGRVRRAPARRAGARAAGRTGRSGSCTPSRGTGRRRRAGWPGSGR